MVLRDSSWISAIVVDAVAADRLGLALGTVADSDGGPTGTVVEVRPVETSWALDLDGRTRSVAGAVSWDVYAYADLHDDNHSARRREGLRAGRLQQRAADVDLRRADCHGDRQRSCVGARPPRRRRRRSLQLLVLRHSEIAGSRLKTLR